MSRMRVLLDQMIDADVAAALAAEGHDVVRAASIGMAQADDADILKQSIAVDRVLVTLAQRKPPNSGQRTWHPSRGVDP